MDKGLVSQLLVLFIIVQILGVYTGMNFIKEDVQVTIVSENPEDVGNAVWLFGYMMVFTGMLLFMIFFFKGGRLYWVLKALETLAVFGTSLLVFVAFVPDAIALFLAVLIVALRIAYAKNVLLRNASAVIAVAGAGALIGVSLGVLPVLVFIVLLGIYDFIAVFKTKHMVVMAKAITKRNLAFTFALPGYGYRAVKGKLKGKAKGIGAGAKGVKGGIGTAGSDKGRMVAHMFELGTGDMVIPLMFAVSVMKSASAIGFGFPVYLVPAAMVLLGSIVGLVITIDYSSRHVGKALPALPLQVVFMLVFYGLAKVAGF